MIITDCPRNVCGCVTTLQVSYHLSPLISLSLRWLIPVREISLSRVHFIQEDLCE